MGNRKASKNTLSHEFPVTQRVSDDRETRRILVLMPKGWRFDSLNTSEGRIRLSFKRVKAARKAGRATGYAGDRQRLLRS